MSSAPRSVRLVRTATFSAAHRYFSPKLSEAENRKVFGSLYRDKGFGHNFLLEAQFTGEIDPLTGMIANLVDIDRWLKEVTDLLDHRHLNEVLAFEGLVPTPERLAQFTFSELKSRMTGAPSSARLIRTVIYEGDQLSAAYSE